MGVIQEASLLEAFQRVLLEILQEAPQEVLQEVSLDLLQEAFPEVTGTAPQTEGQEAAQEVDHHQSEEESLLQVS